MKQKYSIFGIFLNITIGASLFFFDGINMAQANSVDVDSNQVMDVEVPIPDEINNYGELLVVLPSGGKGYSDSVTYLKCEFDAIYNGPKALSCKNKQTVEFNKKTKIPVGYYEYDGGFFHIVKNKLTVIKLSKLTFDLPPKKLTLFYEANAKSSAS